MRKTDTKKKLGSASGTLTPEDRIMLIRVLAEDSYQASMNMPHMTLEEARAQAKLTSSKDWQTSEDS